MVWAVVQPNYLRGSPIVLYFMNKINYYVLKYMKVKNVIDWKLVVQATFTKKKKMITISFIDCGENTHIHTNAHNRNDRGKNRLG